MPDMITLAKGLGEWVVHMVRVSDGQSVRVKRGEKAGRKLVYHNVVSDCGVLRAWNGSGPLTLTAKMLGDDDCVIIVQAANHGPILAAARVR